MPISPEVQSVSHRRIYAVALSIASLLSANIYALNVQAESQQQQGVNVIAANAPDQIGGVVIRDCLTNPEICLPDVTITTLPPPTTVPALKPTERHVPQKPSRSSSPRPTIAPATTTPPPPLTGSKQEWLVQSGVSEADYEEIDLIFTPESGWRPDAVNRGGCIGLGQNCPHKGETWLDKACPNWRSDPVCQIKRFDEYAKGRYGSWENALRERKRKGWW